MTSETVVRVAISPGKLEERSVCILPQYGDGYFLLNQFKSRFKLAYPSGLPQGFPRYLFENRA